MVEGAVAFYNQGGVGFVKMHAEQLDEAKMRAEHLAAAARQARHQPDDPPATPPAE